MNKNAIEILKDNQNKINWNLLSFGNPLDIYYNSKQKKIFNKFESCSIET
jgi:hypothetical protein